MYYFMYFSIPQEELMPILLTMIEEQGKVAFQNRAGICSDTFLELLGAYLQSTILCYEDEYFIQSSGAVPKRHLYGSMQPEGSRQPGR